MGGAHTHGGSEGEPVTQGKCATRHSESGREKARRGNGADAHLVARAGSPGQASEKPNTHAKSLPSEAIHGIFPIQWSPDFGWQLNTGRLDTSRLEARKGG